jgi:hypothetical protein
MKAIAIVPKSVLKSKIVPWVEAKAKTRGLEIEWVDVSENPSGYKNLVAASRNVIAWNCRVQHDWMKSTGNNILYVDNSLISQKAGIFIDNGGFFSNSNLNVKKSWLLEGNPHLAFIAKRDFNWELLKGPNLQGPVLVALQLRDDCNVNFEFPLAENEQDKVVASLKILKKHLPRGRKILVRPHPREWDNFSCNGVWRDDWEISQGGPFYPLLEQCSALVSVNSTCVSEAALLGIPTATLGRGAFSSAGFTLDCSEKPERLSGLLDFSPPTDRALAYCAAVLSHNFIPYDVAEGRQVLEFERWLQAAS